jgi:hypothetical protein
MSLRFGSWLMSFGEFMYGKMHCAYMTSCVVAGGEVLFSKMRHRQQRYGHGPVKTSYLQEAMRLVGMWHAKMRQHGPVVQSDIWRCWYVHVLVCKAFQVKCVRSRGTMSCLTRAKMCAKTRRQDSHLRVSAKRLSSTCSGTMI